jgi:tetratricopeptide (TPR) repeat protein
MAKTKLKTTMATEAFETDELLALARLDMERGNVEAALSKLKLALMTENPLPEAQTMAARLYAQFGLYDRARALYEAYLQTNPGSITEKFQLGMTHFDTGQSREALAMWEALLKEFPTHPPALFYKALVLAQQSKTADAKQTLDILMKSAAADNLYFGRGKELLQSINNGPGLSAGNSGEGGKRITPILPQDVYKTEH